MRARKTVALAAVRSRGSALGYAARALLADRDVVLEAVQQDGWAIVFAKPSLRADPAIAAAVARRPANKPVWLLFGV